MQKQLSIKTLAKGMRVEDKAKLLFADRNKRAETSGEEGLLTPEEEKALIEDAQNLHQIGELNRLNELYKLASFITIDIQTSYLHFRIAEGRIFTILTGMVLAGEAHDILKRVIYDLASNGYTEEQLDEQNCQDEADEKAYKLWKKYKGEGMSDIYNYFEDQPINDSYFSTKNELLGQPNMLLQKAFIQTVNEVKKYKKQVFQCNYIKSKAGMELLSDMQIGEIERFTKEINFFINLEDYLGLIKMYWEFYEKGYFKDKEFFEAGFMDAIKDMEKYVSLSGEEEEKAKKDIDEIIYKLNH
jgi:hypothetical protein